MKKTLLWIITVLFTVFVAACTSEMPITPTPTPEQTPTEPDEIALYVSANGDDNAEGTLSDPIATLNEAVKRISKISEGKRTLPVNLYFAEGEYRTLGISFDEKLSGTMESPISFMAKGNVLFSGGVTLDTSKFKKVDGTMAERLDAKQREYVYSYDLGADGITRDMLGDLESNGKSAEVFCNDNRMTLARYPDEGFIKILSVFSETETGSDGGTVALFEEDNERAKRWLVEPDQIMLKGYVGVDWSMFTSPITSVNTDFHLIKIRDKSPYGLSKNGPFFLYNIYEELTTENEYYIDRENLMLYIYSENDIASKNIVISVLGEPIVKANGADYITFEGITFAYTRYNGIELSDCNNWIFDKCTLKNIGNWGMIFDGNDFLFENGEVYHTGFGGISVSGGDKENLIDANNLVTNTYVHDWSEIKLTHGAGVEICGCGNTVSHCELARSPYFAIYYDGVDETIEYNYIHDVVQQSNDAGAIYCGRSWTSYNDVIRYNIIENIGNDNYSPIGIYWDDTLSGQTAYGNIINNVGNLGMLIGGGHDNTVDNNIFMNCKGYTIAVDSRGLSWNDGWLDFSNPNGLWADLDHYRNLEAWKERFPELQRLQKGKRSDPDYVKNPSNNVIENNILIALPSTKFSGLQSCDIVQTAIDLGKVQNNYNVYKPGFCINEKTYELRADVRDDFPTFIDIPINEIGLIK